MNVIHAVGWYFPESVGGSEVYVEQLVQHLKSHGIEGRVAAPSDGQKADTYVYHDIPIYRYPVVAPWSRQHLFDPTPHSGFDAFARWLKAQRVDVYHQHSWTFGCGLPHLRLAKTLGLATVVTTHLVGTTCLRGTMLLHGRMPCDGRIEETRCGACWGKARGIPTLAAYGLARIPPWLGRSIGRRLPPSPVTTAISTTALVEEHRHSFAEMMQLADRVVTVCQWQYETLQLNGADLARLVLCRQGVSVAPGSIKDRVRPETRSRRDGQPLRIGFLGRWTPGKGAHVLVRAVRRLPKDIPVEAVFHIGGGHDAVEAQYRTMVLHEAVHDPRIHILPPVPHEDVLSTLADFDLLAVPSQWLETGPLVAYEALAAGTPVLGSNLGGIAELIQHGTNGWLVPAANVPSWTEAIARLAQDGELLKTLRAYRSPVRTMADVAEEMAMIYRGLTR